MRPFEYEQTTDCLSTADGLYQIRMNASERRRARASMHQAELIATFIMRAYECLGHAFGFIGRHSGILVSTGKATTVTPGWR